MKHCTDLAFRVKVLLSNGSTVDVVGPNRMTALISASMDGHLQTVEVNL